MVRYLLIATIGLLALAAGLSQSHPALASVHCMRIWAVMAGVNGNASIQYIELRMSLGGQNLTNGSQLHFFDSTGGNETIVTLNSTVPNSQMGASILIGTSAFDAAWAAGSPDFTMPANVMAPDGKVAFGPPGGLNCAGQANYYDSVAYGTGYNGAVNYGSKFNTDLPTSGNQAIKLKDAQFDTTPVNNSLEYELVTNPQPCKNAPSGSPVCGPVVPISDADGDGVTDGSDNCPGTAAGAQVDANGCAQVQVDGDLDGKCDPTKSSPMWCTGTDNCPSSANAFQGNLDGDTDGDACDPDIDGDGSMNGPDLDDDNDGVSDAAEGQCRDDADSDTNGKANDGCPAVGLAETTPQCNNNTDDDSDGYVNDGCPGATETNACGSDPMNAGRRPERLDGAFAGVNDDGDSTTDEALPSPGSDGFDCDGDGWSGSAEKYIFSAGATANDQDPCGASGWPADMLSPDFLLENGISILDMADFIDPVRWFDTDVADWPSGQQAGARRHDLQPGDPFGLGAEINILDLAMLVEVNPPPAMLGVSRVFDTTCPWPG